jgi:hypothetical protein
MKNGSAAVGKSLIRRAAPSLARQPGALPAAANAGRVVVNGGWYHIPSLVKQASHHAADRKGPRGARGGHWLPYPRQSGPFAVFQSIEKLVPQPQADLALGLRTAKWLPMSSSV